ncbi:hypothetical protein F7O43_09770 [Neisseria meningitidis]|nr:hypothetical protein A6J51_10010 [Neisseria meningitidis]EJU58283.1 hypothetical protein NMEN183_1093 [Neisseria meningitidis NM183]EJU60927.1 hypothetical protein NMEN2781_1295 [Neisseria meningitidis NM2781]EJU65320.1 hypothetical protein NMEN576_1111 [Neisseria meningitidis NM576]MBG8580605.1 hypothetical protein [Neisseria meningitidis]
MNNVSNSYFFSLNRAHDFLKLKPIVKFKSHKPTIGLMYENNGCPDRRDSLFPVKMISLQIQNIIPWMIFQKNVEDVEKEPVEKVNPAKQRQ